MNLKIAFTGPESSGKTTISKALSDELQGIWVEEYAREYLQSKLSYNQADLDIITQGQLEKWQVKADLLVADTEMTVIKIWSEYRYKSCSPMIEEAYRNQKFNHYFLCKPDIPWEYDPLRENPSNRDELFELYQSELLKLKRSFTILEGNLETRLTLCREVLSAMKLK